MVRTVVIPRVTLAGVAALDESMMKGQSRNVHLFSQKLNHDMMTMKTAGV